MLCSAAPEKVSALNLKRLKADNKTCGQSQKNTTTQRGVVFFWCGDFAARKTRPPAAALDMAPTPGQKRRRFRVSFFIILRG